MRGQSPFLAFSAEDNETWRLLFERQSSQLSEQVVDLFEDGLRILQMEASRIPDLAKINHLLSERTGFRAIPVEGLEKAESFFQMLACREFPIGNFIRSRNDLTYTPEPDIFHDLYGHVPFLMNLDYANFCADLAQRALQHRDSPDTLRQFDRLFWFTIEFGLIETDRGRRVFGAGIASSSAERTYALGYQPEVLPFDPDAIRTRDYQIDQIQPTLFLMKKPSQLYSCLDAFEASHPIISLTQAVS